MAQPQPYSPSHDFIPDTNIGHVPGQQLDIEFNNLKTTTDQIRANLALIQNDDTTLKNGVVGTPQLNSSLQATFNSLQAALATKTGPQGPQGIPGNTTGNFANTTGIVWQHSPDVSPAANDQVFGLNYSPTTFTNNGTYKDAVWQLGTNQGPGGRIDASKPSTFFQFENRFWDGAAFNQEWHLISVNTDGTTHRPITMTLPWLSVDHSHAGVSFSFDTYQFTTYNATSGSQLAMALSDTPNTSTLDFLQGAHA
ncbi:MAG TPA: hypothetical protein VNM37_17415, partial [Candidatus Dormibacteraeota bacterium]|nr:hypothetical protein [Candidatus Dormibacteraeota bacterium]